MHVSNSHENITFPYKVQVAPGTNWSLLAHDGEYVTDIEEFQPTEVESTHDFTEGDYEHAVRDGLIVDFVLVFSGIVGAIKDCVPRKHPILMEVWDILCRDSLEK